MITKKVKIDNKTGLHARPASILVDMSSKFDADLKLLYKNREANLKSIISLMALAIGPGEKVIIQAEGVDAEDAIEEIISVINNDFK